MAVRKGTILVHF